MEVEEIIGYAFFGKHKIPLEDIFKYFYPDDIAFALNSKNSLLCYGKECVELDESKDYIKCLLKNNIELNKEYVKAYKDVVVQAKKELAEESQQKANDKTFTK